MLHSGLEPRRNEDCCDGIVANSDEYKPEIDKTNYALEKDSP